MLIRDSRDGFGILTLQHQGFNRASPAWSLDMRTSILGVRVTDRWDKGEGLGQFEYDPESAGDLTGALNWPRASRPISGWAWAWPAALSGGGNMTTTKSIKASSAGGGGGGGGGGAGGGGGGGGADGAFVPKGGASFGGVKTNYGGGSSGASFSGVKTNFSGGKPGVTFTDAPKTKDANAPKSFDVKANVAAPGGAGGGGCASCDGVNMLPLIGDKIEPDTRYAQIVPRMPQVKGRDQRLWPKFPRDWRGIALNSTWEADQIEYFMPTDPRLVAVNINGDAQMGSMVCEMGGGFEVDPDFTARLQSAWRVVRPKDGCVPIPSDPERSGKKMNGLAWQLGPAGCDDAWGRGMMIDRVSGGSGDASTTVASDRIVALASKYETGPIHCGERGDLHRIGMTEDGQEICSAHISTGALFKRDKVYDAPLDFDGDYIEPESGGHIMRTYLRFRAADSHQHICGGKPGLWKWESECIGYSPEINTPPGIPVDEPPPTDEPTHHFMPIPSVNPGQQIPTDEPSYANPTAIPGTGDGKLDVNVNPVPPDWTYPPTRPWEPPDGPQRYVATSAELSIPSLLFRPIALRPDLQDLRVAVQISPLAQYFYDSFAPMVLHAEPWGAAQTKGWNYTMRAGAAGSRYRGGTANGGVVFLPPELSIDDYLTTFAPVQRTLSTSYVDTIPGVYFASGYPDLATGGIKTGYRWGGNAAGDLTFDRVNSSGTATATVIFYADGSVSFAGGTKYAIRTAVADTTLTATDHTVIMNAVIPTTVTLPSAASAGTIVYQVKNATANAVTIRAAGGNTIDGSPTYVITATNGSVELKCDGATWWVF